MRKRWPTHCNGFCVKLRWTATLLALSCVCAACADFPSVARDQFVWDNSCPEARVTVTERTDVAPHVLLHPSEPVPPPEVAGDRERMVMWRRNWMRAYEREDDSTSVYSVTGCDTAETVLCTMAPTRHGQVATCTSTTAAHSAVPPQ